MAIQLVLPTAWSPARRRALTVRFVLAQSALTQQHQEASQRSLWTETGQRDGMPGAGVLTILRCCEAVASRMTRSAMASGSCSSARAAEAGAAVWLDAAARAGAVIVAMLPVLWL
jgi:hypothetical protein